MILPIYLYGNPILRKQSVDITKDYPDIEKLISNMFETMYRADGVGLAAPQIGKNIDLFIVDASRLADDRPELKDFKRVFINPKITFLTDETIGIEEGCLSIPNIHEFVQRPKELSISYLNEKFEPVTEVYSDYRAIVIQHEYDHLNGILFVDKISPLRRRLLQSKLNNITRGKVDVDYKVKI
ncbi:MAG TPA: peptide deformylase [Bacteroidales bacterium]|nr:peptide deformylase [Bacteroidales bacterium]HOL98053.1 peptide deformylase [Bacteroidales bacterium]HOM37112.1 peptide deformylase [Bacteroidales bacterium]HPD23639.1 peptide deformylase [Bacteroidales bacterium]HRS99660.1 peptide deformylase [Bacteroidales bacterium]